MYFSRVDKFLKGKDRKEIEIERIKLFSSVYQNGKWQKSKAFSHNSDQYSLGNPCLSSDGKKLYFVSDMTSGYGGTDIYFSEFINGSWSKPINAGKHINTINNENFPSLDKDGNIYFSDFGQGVREVTRDGILRSVAVDVSTLGTSDQVKQVVVSSDGVRVAVVLSNGIQDVVSVGAVFRTDTETRIIGLHRIERSITAVRDILWSSPTSIAVIGSDETKSELVFDVSLLDGKTKLFSTPVGAQQISVDGTGRLYISAVDGTNQFVFQQSFGTWVQVTSGTGGFLSK
jgi:hypothetical protein